MSEALTAEVEPTSAVSATPVAAVVSGDVLSSLPLLSIMITNTVAAAITTAAADIR